MIYARNFFWHDWFLLTSSSSSKWQNLWVLLYFLHFLFDTNFKERLCLEEQTTCFQRLHIRSSSNETIFERLSYLSKKKGACSTRWWANAKPSAMDKTLQFKRLATTTATTTSTASTDERLQSATVCCSAAHECKREIQEEENNDKDNNNDHDTSSQGCSVHNHSSSSSTPTKSKSNRWTANSKRVKPITWNFCRTTDLRCRGFV